MPIYEYRCPEGHAFELLQRMTDPPPGECQICGASPVTKVLYPAAVHFKGSGFYTTDYGRARRRDSGDGASASESAKSGEKSEKGESATGKSDSASSKGDSGSSKGDSGSSKA
jgi:putative FmdB family regulatory protein